VFGSLLISSLSGSIYRSEIEFYVSGVFVNVTGEIFKSKSNCAKRREQREELE